MKMKKIDYPSVGETLYVGELPNGLPIRVIPKPGFSSFYAVFGTNYGGAMRTFEVDGEKTDTPAGVAHFLEHKMFDLPNGDNALEMLSANGADPNAFTSSGVTMYYFHCTEGFEDNLKLLLHFVSTPYFTPETVAKEQGIIGQEIRMTEDSPGNAIYYNLLSLLYANHPIKDKVAGTIESIAEITDKTLYDCHKVFYSPSNMVLCVEGDVDPERIYEIAEAALPKEKASIPHADFGPAETCLPVQSDNSVQMAVSAPQFLIGAKVDQAPEGGKAELRNRLVASLALRLLIGSSSRFYTSLYSEGILNRDFDSEIDYSAGTATLLIGGESNSPSKVLEELNKAVFDVAANGFADDYFLRAKKANIGSQLRGLEDFDNVCVSVAMDLFDGFCTFDSIELLEGITRKDCEQWITANMVPERLAISVVTPDNT